VKWLYVRWITASVTSGLSQRLSLNDVDGSCVAAGRREEDGRGAGPVALRRPAADVEAPW